MDDLTDAENTIFYEILRRKRASAGDLLRVLHMHKGTLYNALRRMQHKGIVGATQQDSSMIFSINPTFLKRLEHNEHQRHTKARQEILDIREIIEANDQERETKTTVYSGTKAFKSFFDNLLTWASHDKEYLFMGKGNEMIEHLGRDYYIRTQERKRRNNIHCRVILSAGSEKLPVHDHVSGDVRYMKMKHFSPVSTWIFGTKTAIVLWDAHPIQTIVIESKGLSDSYRSYFEHIWQSL